MKSTEDLHNIPKTGRIGRFAKIVKSKTAKDSYIRIMEKSDEYNKHKPDKKALWWKNAPWKNEVLVEHENNIRRLEYTFFKFEEISAPLKVGIFYPREEDEDKYLQKTRQMILKQVSSYPGGVYLLIFGFCEEGKGVYWHGYEIDFKAFKNHNKIFAFRNI